MSTTVFALLLPVTSRGAGGRGVQPAYVVEDSLRGFVQSILATTNRSDRSITKVFIGIDVDDDVLDQTDYNIIERVFGGTKIDFVTIKCEVQPSASSSSGAGGNLPPQGQVCYVWRKLADAAYKAGAEYVALLGDDVRLLSPRWTSEIRNEFKALRREALRIDSGSPVRSCHDFLPEGFGVLCFTDVNSQEGFPGFPVLHRTHFEIFDGEVIPENFINQDADPWLFQVYLRFGAARLMPNARITNTIGGCEGERNAPNEGPRYQKVRIDWKADMLGDGVKRVRDWLKRRLASSPTSGRCSLPRFVTMDVLVPTIRIEDLTTLRKICSLEVPPFMRTMFVIIVDKPDAAGDKKKKLTEELQLAAGTNACRVRWNPENIGAGPSRNAALDECCADWALFLDDDVTPSTTLLRVYGDKIIELTADPSSTEDKELAGEALVGFVGKTEFPPAATWLQRSAILSDLTFMYGVSDILPNPKWGVTANLLVNVAAHAAGGTRGGQKPTRADVRFGGQFPKAGGGEDVDFCLKHQKATGGSFAAVPMAIVKHPWWPGGRKKTFNRFWGWSVGDGQLKDIYPEYTYWAAPNVAESMLMAPCIPLVIDAILWVSALNGFTWEPGGRCFTGADPSMAESYLRGLVTYVVLPPLAVWASEVTYDAFRNIQRKERLPEVTGLGRVAASFGASCLITWLEFGRTAGHRQRGGLMGVVKNCGWRFDWHCGRLEGAEQDENTRARRKVALHVFFGTLVWVATKVVRRDWASGWFSWLFEM